MRGYALLLGITLTIGYGYAGQVALTSVQAANRHASVAAPAAGPPGALCSAGRLARTTVEATGREGAHAVVPALRAHRVDSCPAPGQPRSRTIPSEKARPSIGLEM